MGDLRDELVSKAETFGSNLVADAINLPFG